MKDLKEKTIRGGLARVLAQVGNFTFRIGSVMILGRILGPRDFGLVGMVTAFTGVLGLFRDFGLSSVAVHREYMSEEQTSTLFWVNVAVGAALAVLALIFAPFLVRFYHEPRLLGIAMVQAVGFVFNALGVQHSARLQRQMRFTALSVINLAAMAASGIIAVIMAWMGYGYWALVAMAITLPLTTTVGVWIAGAWVPGRPHSGVGIISMMRFGGTLTLNGLVVYVAYNMEKILLGRFWGVEAIGFYSRAYQLINTPTDSLNYSVGEVAFAALSRLQNDRPRLRNYFLKGYSLVLAMTIPITIMCAFFANDMIFVLLGPKWHDAALIFQLLAPTILVFAMINPLAWLLFALGLVGRGLKVALVLAPLVIAGYVAGLRYGPVGVAIGYSGMLMLWLIPDIVWCVRDTGISLRDILVTAGRPLVSGLVAVGPALALHRVCSPVMPPFVRLTVAGLVLLTFYLGVLFYGMGQERFYMDILKGFRKRSAPDRALAPA
jgi:O-antigen/teichoic acid export membrane protein